MNNKLLMVGVAVLVALFIIGGAFFFFNSNQTPTGVSNSEPSEAMTQESVEPTEEPTDDTSSEKVQIELTSSGFSPKTITIDKGTTVVWTNNSGKAGTVDSAPHPVHTSMPEANLGSFNDGETLEFTFENAGTYNYHNHFNPAQGGSVTIE